MTPACWPRIADPGIVCACGKFKIHGAKFSVAQERWREHFKEANRD